MRSLSYQANVGAMGVSPELKWTQVPPASQSFVLLMHDPEPALNRGIDGRDALAGMEYPRDSDRATGGRRGGCGAPRRQPSGQPSLQRQLGPGAPAGPYHQYTFELYAVDTKVDVPQATPQQAADTRTAVMKAIDGHILSKAIIVGRFHQ